MATIDCMETTVLSYLPSLRGIRADRRRYHTLRWQEIGKVEQRKALASCRPNTYPIDLDALERGGFWEPEEEEPARILISAAGNRSRQHGIHCQCWTKPLPLHAIMRVSRDLYACSPAFAALLYTRGRSLAESLMLLMELLGTYTLPEGSTLPISWGGCWPDDANRENVDQAHVRCDPAVTPKELALMAKWATSSADSTFRTAVKLACEGSNSPMESVLYGFFSPSRRFGGLGVGSFPGGMLLNHRIDLSSHAVHMASGIPYAICDAYVPAARVDLEYNGSVHELVNQRIHDGQRNNGLRGMDVKVIVINRDQMRDVVALEAIADSLRRDARQRRKAPLAGYRSRQTSWLNGLRGGIGLKAI